MDLLWQVYNILVHLPKCSFNNKKTEYICFHIHSTIYIKPQTCFALLWKIAAALIFLTVLNSFDLCTVPTLHLFSFPPRTMSPSVFILSRRNTAFSVLAVWFVMLFPEVVKIITSTCTLKSSLFNKTNHPSLAIVK